MSNNVAIIIYITIYVFNACISIASAQNQNIDSLQKRLIVAQGVEKIELLNRLTIQNWRVDNTKFMEYNQQLLSESNRLNFERGKLLYKLNKCREFYLNGSVDSMASFSKIAISKATILKDKEVLSEGLKFLGVSFRLTGQIDSSIQFLKLAYNLKLELKDDLETAKLAYNLGNLYHQSSQFADAIHYLLKAAELDEKLKNYSGYAWDCNLIGGIYMDMNNESQGIEYLTKAQKILIEIQDKTGLGENYNFFGTYYLKINEWQKAETSFLKSLQLYEETGNERGMSASSNNLGIIYEKMGKYDLAIYHSLKSLEYKKSKNDLIGLSGSLGNLGSLYQKLGDYSKAIKFKKESAQLAAQGGFKDFEKNAYLSLSEIYSKLGDYKNAFYYHQMFFKTYDEIYKDGITNQVAEMQAKFDVQQKQRENELLKLNLQLQNAQINDQLRASSTKNIIFASFAMVMITVIVAGFVYYNRYRETQKLRAEVMVKEAENLERKRISQDLHDHVGAQLTYVITNLDWIVDPPKKFENTDNKLMLKSIRDASKQAILTLRETVWALNHSSISVEELSDKLKQFAYKMLEFHEGINVNFQEDITLSEILAPNDALNIFRICQESFTNALKHSGAGQISIEIKSNHEYNFYFSIQDNGAGFDVEEAAKKGHYGLGNMHERAKNIGLIFDLETHVKKGTRIELYLKKSHA